LGLSHDKCGTETTKRLTRDEARRIVAASPSCLSCCAGLLQESRDYANGQALAWLASARGNFLHLASWKGMDLNHSSTARRQHFQYSRFFAGALSTLRIDLRIG
jgi:hypothetical protein